MIIQRGSAGRKIEPGWVPTSQQERGTVTDPDAFRSYEKAMEEEGLVRGEVARNLAEARRQQAAYLSSEAKRYGDEGLARRAEINNRLFELESDRADLAEKKVDPSKYWTDRGVLGSILTVLGAVSGTYGAALSRTPNYAMEEINNGMDREMEAQKANIELRKAGLNAKMSLLEKYSQNNDPETAEQMARQLMMESILAEAEGQKETEESKILKAQMRSSLEKMRLDMSAKEYSTASAYQQGGYVGGSPSYAVDPELGLKLGTRDAQGRLLVSPAEERKLLSGYRATRAQQMAKGGGGVAALSSTEREANVKDSSDLRRLQQAREEIARAKGGAEETLPGFGAGAAIKRSAAVALGQPKERYTGKEGIGVKQAIQVSANIIQQDLGKSDADAEIALRMARADGTKRGVLNAIDKQIETIQARVRQRTGAPAPEQRKQIGQGNQ